MEGASHLKRVADAEKIKKLLRKYGITLSEVALWRDFPVKRHSFLS